MDNSKEKLDEYFLHHWEANNGREQSKFFMRLILEYLPLEIRKKVAEAYSIVDIGCAMGDGTALLREAFYMPQILGLDLSSVAINKAKDSYSRILFSCRDFRQTNHRNTVTVCSNMLEHFEDPLSELNAILSKTSKLCIILCPFEEKDRIPGHLATITASTFPEQIQDFKKIFQKVIDTRDSKYWHGYQLLEVFERCPLG